MRYGVQSSSYVRNVFRVMVCLVRTIDFVFACMLGKDS